MCKRTCTIQPANKKAVIYTKGKGAKNRLYLSYYNENKHAWENPLKISDNSEYIGAFSTAVTSKGTLSVLINSSELIDSYEENQEESPYANASLELISTNDVCDIKISDASYISNSFVSGEWMEINYTVTNNGTVPASGEVVLTDTKNNVLSKRPIYEEILPGQSINETIPFNVPDNISELDVVLTVNTSFSEEGNLDNNKKNLHIVYEDLMVENATYVQTKENYVISADIINKGFTRW